MSLQIDDTYQSNYYDLNNKISYGMENSPLLRKGGILNLKGAGQNSILKTKLRPKLQKTKTSSR